MAVLPQKSSLPSSPTMETRQSLIQSMSMPKPENVPSPSSNPQSSLKTPSSLVLGGVGTGKTDCLLSFISAGIDVFVLITEPTGVDTLIDGAARRTRACAGKIDYLSHLHYHTVQPASMSTQMLIEMAENAMKRDPGELQKMSSALCKKEKFPQYIEMLKVMQNFPCDRTGEMFGDVTTWDDTRAFCIDSLSGVTFAVARHVSGLRGILTQPEYQVGQQLIMNLVMQMCGLKCFFALTAHEEWERDELSQKQSKMVATLGSKIAPQIPVPFSDVIKSYRNEAGFWWSTNSADTTTKWRSLPSSNKLPPDFSPVVSVHRQRKRLILEANTKKE